MASRTFRVTAPLALATAVAVGVAGCGSAKDATDKAVNNVESVASEAVSQTKKEIAKPIIVKELSNYGVSEESANCYATKALNSISESEIPDDGNILQTPGMMEKFEGFTKECFTDDEMKKMSNSAMNSDEGRAAMAQGFAAKFKVSEAGSKCFISTLSSGNISLEELDSNDPGVQAKVQPVAANAVKCLQGDDLRNYFNLIGKELPEQFHKTVTDQFKSVGLTDKQAQCTFEGIVAKGHGFGDVAVDGNDVNSQLVQDIKIIADGCK